MQMRYEQIGGHRENGAHDETCPTDIRSGFLPAVGFWTEELHYTEIWE
jgi:hypothetical protein